MSGPFDQQQTPFQPQPPYQQTPPYPQQQQPYPQQQQQPQYQPTPQSYQQQAPYQQQQPYQQQAGAQSGLSDNAAGALAYVTIIPAIIFLGLAPYNRSPFVRFHAWQSIFLTIAAAVAWAVLMVIGFIPIFNLIDVVLGPLVWLAFFVLWIILLVKAISGARFKLPIIGDYAEKQAGN